MPPVRSFVAIELADDVREQVALIQRALRTAMSIPVSWTNPDGIHLTLQFLGNIPEERIDDIGSALEGVAARHSRFPLTLGAPGTFPNLAHPRVLWIGLRGDVERLADLQRDVQETLVPLGFPPEERAFHPHLTLGRVRQPAAGFNTKQLESIADESPVTQPVGSISLMRSDLRPKGARYARLGEWRLKATS